MRVLIKVWILVILIMSVVVHHAATHAGSFYDSPNLFSHEAIVTFLLGMAISLIIWGKAR